MTEVFLSEHAVKDRQRLDAHQEDRLRALARRLARDVTLGDPILRDRIPKALRRSYNATNLWRLELPGAWRVLYTIETRPGAEPTVSILRIVDHRAYDRLFGYKKS